MRELDINPCDHQRALMESLGFTFESSSYDWPRVRWMGHGIALECFMEHDAPTAPVAMAAIIKEAREAGSRDRLELFKTAMRP